jgi:predicted ATPase/DNA-binding SARP family transcriptional activator
MRSPTPTTAVRLTLLGAPRLTGPDGPRPLPWHKTTALVAYLACQPDWVSRDALATWLQPEAGEDSARAYLRRLLHRLKDQGLADGLEIEAQRVRWVGAADVRELDAAARAQDWPRVRALYGGPLLDGAGLAGEAAIDEFFADARERYRTRWRMALTAEIDALAARGERGAIAPLMEQLADDDGLDEDGVQFLLDRAGSEPERGVALAAFETLQRRLAYEMALRPLPATQALAQALRERVFAAAATAGAAVAPAPPRRAPLTPFVGRAAELISVRTLLGERAAMVTLLGPGGVGKTRLAQEVQQLWDGASAFVDLTDVGTLPALLTAFADSLALPAGLPGTPEQQLSGWLAARLSLVVLDNAETLVAEREALALLARLVAAAPAVRWLVTSREPLALTAEHCVPLGGLSVQPEQADAAALFIAQAARHGYEVQAEDDAAIARIARAVDGMPLALELAAHWTRAMRPAEIAEAIAQDLDFLHSDAADRKPGHRSLRSVFDSSWRRLDAAAQAALAALTVCRGSFDAAAARAVAGADRALLLRLAGKSLLQRTTAGRFRLHAQMAQFCAEHLDEAQRIAVQRRHALHFLQRLAARDDLVLGRHAGHALAELRPDMDNLRAAWRHAISLREWTLLHAAVDPAELLLSQLRRYAEAADGFARAADACPPSHPLRTRARVAQALAVIGAGDLAAGTALLDALEQLQLAPAEQADVANGRAMVTNLRGEKAEALVACERARAAAEAAGDLPLQAQAALNLAVTRWASGDAAGSEAHAVQTLALAERIGADLTRARAQRVLSVLRREQGRLDEAQVLLERSLQFFESVGETYEAAYNLRGLSYMMADRKDPAAQLDYARRALAAYQSLGLPVPIVQTEFALGLALVAAGERSAAAATLRQCLRGALRLSLQVIALRALAELAALHAAVDRALAVQVLRFVVQHPSLRASDRPEFEQHLQALQADETELAAADAANAANASERIETLAALLLAVG